VKRREKAPHVQVEDPRLLEPGWVGEPTDTELAYIQRQLMGNPHLSQLWGFPPRWKRRPLEAVRRVAIWGDPHDRPLNRRLARGWDAVEHRAEIPQEGFEVAVRTDAQVNANDSATTGPEVPVPKREKPGRPRRQVPVPQAKELVAQGIPVRQIARQLGVPETTLRGALKGA